MKACVTKPLCCTTETNTILQINYTVVFKKKGRGKSSSSDPRAQHTRFSVEGLLAPVGLRDPNLGTGSKKLRIASFVYEKPYCDTSQTRKSPL